MTHVQDPVGTLVGRGMQIPPLEAGAKLVDGKELGIPYREMGYPSRKIGRQRGKREEVTTFRSAGLEDLQLRGGT